MLKKSIGALIVAVAVFVVSTNAASFAKTVRHEAQITMQSETMMSSKKSDKNSVKKAKSKKAKRHSVKTSSRKTKKS